MSTQYVGCDCLVYESNCQGLKVGHEFKKLLPVYSSLSTYSYHQRIPNDAPTATSVFTSRPINSTYLQWVDNTPPDTKRRSSTVIGNERIVLGSPQLTFRVNWCVTRTGDSVCPPSGKLTVVVPEARTNRAFEPWDIKGRRIVFKLPCEESTSGSFTIPGQFRSFLVHASPDLTGIEVEFKITSYFKSPDPYALGEFYVKDCNGSKLLAYTNTRIRGQVLTREPSPLLATFSRLVVDEYKSRTYYIGPILEDSATPPFNPVPNTKTVMYCSSSFVCPSNPNPSCFNYSNVSSSTPPFFDKSGACPQGSTYAQPDISLVSQESMSDIRVDGDYFYLGRGNYYQIELEIEPDGSNNGKDTYGEGVSWDDAYKYSDNRSLVFIGPTSLIKGLELNCGLADDKDNFRLALYDGFGEIEYYDGSNPPPSTDGYVSTLMEVGGEVYPSSDAAPFNTPTPPNGDKPYNFIIRCFDSLTGYYFVLDSCLSRFLEFKAYYYSPLSQFKFKVTVTQMKSA